MSTARSITLYIEPKTLKRLRLALKLYPQRVKDNAEGGILPRLLTIDEWANALLNEKIVENFPLVRGLEKALAQAEKEYIENNQQLEGTHNNETIINT